MDEQGHGTEQWKALEDWAFGELMKIVELRDGRTMDGPPNLALQDFVGKRLRVRYETSGDPGWKNFAEQGTLVLTITSMQTSQRSIVLGVAPCAFLHAAKGITRTVQAVLFDLMEKGLITVARFSVLVDHRRGRGEVQDTRSYGIHPTNVHVLWG